MATTTKNDYKALAGKYKAAFEDTITAFNSEKRKATRAALLKLRDSLKLYDVNDFPLPIDKVAEATVETVDRWKKLAGEQSTLILNLRHDLETAQTDLNVAISHNKDWEKLCGERETEILNLKEQIAELQGRLNAHHESNDCLLNDLSGIDGKNDRILSK